MNVHIRFAHQIADNDSTNLRQLANLVERECDLSVQYIRGEALRGIKDSGLVVALTIAGLALSGVGTLISTLSYWQSLQQRYSVTIERGKITLVLDNVPPRQLEERIAEIEQDTYSLDIDVEIAEK